MTRSLLKIRALFCALALLLLAASGCAVVQPTPTPQPVTIRFALLDGSPERYEAWTQEFHAAYPHITVEIIPAEGGQVDCAMGPIWYLPFLRQEGGVIDLAPYVESDDSIDLGDYDEDAIELLTMDGTLLGLPADIDLIVTYYNKELLDGARVPYPEAGWNWDDFVTLADAVRNEVDGVYGYVWGDATLDNVALAFQNGGWVLDDLRNPTRPTLNDPAVIEALQWFGDLIYLYNVAPTPEQYRAEPFGGISALAAMRGKVGFWLGWISERGGSTASDATWVGNWEFAWGMAPPPTQARAGTLALVNGYYIAQEGAHPDAAWQWISWLSQQTPEWSLPARKSVLTSETYARLVGEETVTLAQTVLAETELIPPSLATFLPALGHYAQAVESVMRGSQTAQEALEAAQTRAGNMRAP